MWSFVEEVEQGIPVPPLNLVLTILRICHAIHVVHDSCDLQPLTAEELSLIEDIMSGKFTFPSAKEARALSEKGELSQSQGRKRKKLLPDTSVVDDCAAARLSAVDATLE